jgi:Uncharacterised nucleotidyltransferase
MELSALEAFARRVRWLGNREELDAAAVEAVDAFDAAGVSYLLLKGPALARLLYTEGEPRGYYDIDVLVAPDDLSAAGRVLTMLGYHNATAGWGVEDIAGAVHADIWVRGNQTIGPLMIDLHRRLAGLRAPAQAAWEALEARRTWMDLNGRRVAVFDRAGLAFHLATHAAQHAPPEPKALGDLAQGLNRWDLPVWREATLLAHEVEAIGAFAAGLRLVPAGAALAAELSLPSSDELEWELAHRHERPRGTFHLEALVQAKDRRERMTVLRRSLLPKREWIVWQHPWAAKGFVRLLGARAVHVLRLPAWAARAWRFRRRARRATR